MIADPIRQIEIASEAIALRAQLMTMNPTHRAA